MSPAQRLAVLFTACAIAATGIVAREGWEETAKPDPVHGNKIPTACAGVTKNIKPGQKFTRDECVERTAVAMIEHAAPIMRCVPDPVPVGMLAEFADHAYNNGPANFCSSTMSRKAMAGDFKGACDGFLLWYKAGGLDCRISDRCQGLYVRRCEARENCYRSINAAAPQEAYCVKARADIARRAAARALR